MKTNRLKKSIHLFWFVGAFLSGCVEREIIAELAPEEDTDIEMGSTSSEEDVQTDADDTDSSGLEKIIPEGECGDSDGEWDNLIYIDYAPELAALTANNRTVTHVTDSLFIDSVEGDSISLEELKNLRCVDGNLQITNVPGLTTLENLSNLWYVGGFVYIVGNPALPDCEATELYNRLSRYTWNHVCIVDNYEAGCGEIPTNCPDKFYNPW